MLAGAHKKFYRIQHAEIYLLDLKVQYKHKMKLSLGMVSKHIFLYFCLPDYSYLNWEESVKRTLYGLANTLKLYTHSPATAPKFGYTLEVAVYVSCTSLTCTLRHKPHDKDRQQNVSH